VEKTQREERKVPAPTAITAQTGAMAQPSAAAQQAASTPPSAPTQQSAPTDAGESNTPNHTQEHKAVAPAPDKIQDNIESTSNQEQAKLDQQYETAHQESHDPARSAPPKEPRPKL
jgi:hypothetical protein